MMDSTPIWKCRDPMHLAGDPIYIILMRDDASMDGGALQSYTVWGRIGASDFQDGAIGFSGKLLAVGMDEKSYLIDL